MDTQSMKAPGETCVWHDAVLSSDPFLSLFDFPFVTAPGIVCLGTVSQ